MLVLAQILLMISVISIIILNVSSTTSTIARTHFGMSNTGRASLRRSTSTSSVGFIGFGDLIAFVVRQIMFYLLDVNKFFLKKMGDLMVQRW